MYYTHTSKNGENPNSRIVCFIEERRKCLASTQASIQKEEQVKIPIVAANILDIRNERNDGRVLENYGCHVADGIANNGGFCHQVFVSFKAAEQCDDQPPR
jgi:hypothetical protein